MPIRIDDKFYFLNLTKFEQPDPARARSSMRSPSRSYQRPRGATIKKESLKTITREVKITFSNNFFLKSHNILCCESLKKGISQ